MESTTNTEQEKEKVRRNLLERYLSTGKIGLIRPANTDEAIDLIETVVDMYVDTPLSNCSNNDDDGNSGSNNNGANIHDEYINQNSLIENATTDTNCQEDLIIDYMDVSVDVDVDMNNEISTDTEFMTLSEMSERLKSLLDDV